MTLQNNNQTPPDADTVLAALRELDSEDQPVEGQENEPQESKTEEEKRRDHAFAKQRRLLQQASHVIKDLKGRQEEAQQVNTQPQQAGQVDSSAQGAAVLRQLQLEAIQNTGISDLNHPLLAMEVNRLYVEKVGQLRARSEAGNKAPQVFETVSNLPQFQRLDEADLLEIGKRVKALNPEGQADERMVKAVFSMYMGENFEKLSALPSGAGNANPEASASGAAAGSAVRRGRGVPPGAGSGGGATPQVKPPDATEAKEMRMIGLDPTVSADVVRYRKAAKARGQWGQG